MSSDFEKVEKKIKIKNVSPNVICKLLNKEERDLTTHAKINPIAKIGPPTPSWNPMAAATAVTVAE